MDVRHFTPGPLLLTLALTLAVLAACSGEGPSTSGKPGKGVYVPLVWKTARVVNNHRVHVAKEHVPCAKCHEIGADSMGKVTPDRCAACHEKQAHFEHARDQAQARFGAGARTDCTTCHVFRVEDAGAAEEEPVPIRMADGGFHVPSPAVPAAGDCMRCHGAVQGDTPAVQVHGTSECVKCHRPHEDSRQSIGPCTECHGEISTNHATKGKDAGQACATCHAHQHAPAADALTSCTSCHEKNEPKVPATALFEGGHTQCVGCHRPHDFTKATAAPCRSCHAEVHVMGGGRVAAHDRCENCHTPHDVRAVGDAACSKCHSSVHPDHPKVTGRTCTSCHDPHPQGAHAAPRARACSSCHQLATSNVGFHGGVACEKCHAPHDFGRTLADHRACAGCHQKPVALTATLAGHAKCEGCHRGLPHRPERLEASCSTCHAAMATAARRGHQQCRSCHEPHGGGLVAECKSCHTVEHRTAPSGHQECAKCHDAHTGSAATAPCGKCHQKEQATPHGRAAGGCTSCHRPHGPSGVASPPACASCHAAAELPGLHAREQHRDCGDCHKGHGEKPAPVRAMCTTCHQDRKNHFPDAPSCGSCHLFGPTR